MSIRWTTSLPVLIVVIMLSTRCAALIPKVAVQRLRHQQRSSLTVIVSPSTSTNSLLGLRRHITTRWCSSSPAEGSAAAMDTAAASTKKHWDLKGLKAEVNRQYLRTFKKVGKANERYALAKKEVDEILKLNDDEVSMGRLEKCPNPEDFRKELEVLQEQLGKLSLLEEELKSIKSVSDARFTNVVDIVTSLGLNDEPPPKQERGPKKPKGEKPKSRMPYHIYQSVQGLEIRVGRGASDNDELSCNPIYRDGADWWMHVAGCAGSHVVIRSHDDQVPETYRETLLDAALLAVVNSKAPQSGKVPVSIVRCRQVSKPGGAKAGLVRLNGDILTIKIDAKAEANRLERLEGTKGS